jgi:hypothetical protein
VHALSEKGTVALLYRNLAVRNKGGMTGLELFEFHLHVAEDPKDTNLVTLRTLSDDEARRLCGDEYSRQVEAKREKVDLRKLKRVQVRSCANGSERQRSVSCDGGVGCVVEPTSLCARFPLARPPPLGRRAKERERLQLLRRHHGLLLFVQSLRSHSHPPPIRRRPQVDGKVTLNAADFDCTKLLIAASVSLTSSVDRAVASSASSPTPLSRRLTRGATKSCAPDVAEAVLSFLAGAVRSLHDRFGRYKEVDEAILRDFVERGMSAAPESSEKEKGEKFCPPSRASEASAKKS